MWRKKKDKLYLIWLRVSDNGEDTAICQFDWNAIHWNSIGRQSHTHTHTPNKWHESAFSSQAIFGNPFKWWLHIRLLFSAIIYFFFRCCLLPTFWVYWLRMRHAGTTTNKTMHRPNNPVQNTRLQHHCTCLWYSCRYAVGSWCVAVRPACHTNHQCSCMHVIIIYAPEFHSIIAVIYCHHFLSCSFCFLYALATKSICKQVARALCGCRVSVCMVWVDKICSTSTYLSIR